MPNTKTYRIGETRKMKCGLNATVIAYRSKSDIDIKFENGVVREHVRYDHFKEGGINTISMQSKSVSHKESRVGETRMMNCGMNASIIEYYGAKEITIRFEDGAVRKNIIYNRFLEGAVAHPDKAPVFDGNQRVGENRKMLNGFNATLIEYRSSADVDVKFDDGSIAKSQSYHAFKNGKIAHPTLRYKIGISLQEFAIFYYLRNYGFRKIKQGEWKNKGFDKFELDFYHDEKKIAIEFDGGLHARQEQIKRDLRKNKKCHKIGIKLYRLRDASLPSLNDSLSINYALKDNAKIMDGIVDCKKELEEILIENNICFNSDDINFNRDYQSIYDEYNQIYLDYYGKERMGQKIYSRYAKQFVTIIAYRAHEDIDVQFDDGAILTNIRYSQFQNGGLKHPNDNPAAQAQNRMNEEKVMNSGHVAKIIKYINSSNIDVEFEDGCIKTGVAYSSFRLGTLQHPSETPEVLRKQRLGEKRKMKNGMIAEIIKYSLNNDIDVRFENGSIRHGVTYASFQMGTITHPDALPEAIAQKRIGEINIMNNGMKAKIIAYRSNRDIDVQFEDGKIRENMSYRSFQIKAIEHPDDMPSAQAINRLGETRIMNSGHTATIVKYFSATNIDVQFEDGKIAKHKRYTKFQNGQIAHPDDDRKTIEQRRLGESHIMNNGQIATIVAYRSSQDIDIQFEDGTIATKKHYCNFRRGEVKNPSK